ncbi:MAG TPA: O-antigen ligase family protein [Thermotogota bacterium]|nr:O-antigen ligase family protein [Thermotogota bacterium]
MKYLEIAFLCFTFLFVALFAHPFLTYEFSTPKYFFLIVFISIGMVFFLLRQWRRKEPTLYIGLPQIGWLGFGIAALLSTFTVLFNNPAYFQFSFEIGIYAFLTVFMVLYFSNLLETKRDVSSFLLFALATGFIVSIEALYNYYTGYSFFLGFYGAGKMGMKATIGNVNFVSDFLGSLLPLSFYFLLSTPLSWNITKKPSIGQTILITLVKAFGGLTFFLFYLVVLLSGTRAVILSLMIGALVLVLTYVWYLWTRRKEKEKTPKTSRVVNGVLTVFAILVLITVPFILESENNILRTTVDVGERTASIFDPRGFQTTGGKARVLAWKASVLQWEDNPIIGAGIGTYMRDSIQYMGDAIQQNPEYVDSWSNFKRTHNDYFQVLGEMGLLGILSVAFTLLVMVWLFFKMLLRMKNRDDALLLILLAVSFVEILGHSFTEFPLHLLPNQLWAIAIGGIGFGSYLNRETLLAWRRPFSKRWILVGILVVAIVGTLAGTLKYRSMMADAYFKEGNGRYSSLSQIDGYRSQHASELQKAKDASQALEQRTGAYERFATETYLTQVIPLIRSAAGGNLTEEEIRLRGLEELSKEIGKEKARLNDFYIRYEDNQLKLNQSAAEIYESARDRLLQSLDLAPFYGRNHYYLAALMIRPERKNILLQQKAMAQDPLDVLRAHFTEVTEDRKHIASAFRLFPLEKDFIWLESKVKAGVSLEKMEALVGINNWYDIQSYRDALSYFHTSFIGFDEKNTYRQMGKSYYTLYAMLRNQVVAYTQLARENPEWEKDLIPLMVSHQEDALKAFEEFKRAYDRAIYLLPGNWQMFPEWESIYSEYISLLLKAQPVQTVYPKIRDIANLRAQACEWMHHVQRIGIPDDIAVFYAQLTQAFLDSKMYQETLYVIDEGLNTLTKAYRWNKDDLENNPYLTEENKNRIRGFLSAYDNLLKNRSLFIDQVLEVYAQAQRNGTFEQLWLEDWKEHQFIDRKWPDATYEEIIALLKRAKAERAPL